jgi:salicylate hydroxylase
VNTYSTLLPIFYIVHCSNNSRMETSNDTFPFSNRQAVSRLNVIVIGAGIAGLTIGLGLRRSGHAVTILEQTREIAEVGAGVQIAPNASRILNRFGVLEHVMESANVIERNILRSVQVVCQSHRQRECTVVR